MSSPFFEGEGYRWAAPVSDHDLICGEMAVAAFPLLYPPPQAGEEMRSDLVQELQILPDEVAADVLGIGVDQFLGDRPRRLAVGNRPTVEALDRQDAEAGRGQKHLLGIGGVEQVDVARRDL